MVVFLVDLYLILCFIFASPFSAPSLLLHSPFSDSLRFAALFYLSLLLPPFSAFLPFSFPLVLLGMIMFMFIFLLPPHFSGPFSAQVSTLPDFLPADDQNTSASQKCHASRVLDIKVLRRIYEKQR